MVNKEIQIMQVGIIGTGFGGFVHVPAFADCASTNVAAIFSRSKSKAQKVAERFQIDRVVASYDEILKSPDIQIVSIATPPATHHVIVMEAVKHGKHVVCEKPFAVNFAEADAMYQVTRNASLVNAIGHQMRFHPNHVTVKNILDGGDLGRIIQVNLSYSTSNRIDATLPWDWRSDQNAGGGELNAMGSHQIDLLRWWFGEVETVSGTLKTFIEKRKDPTHGELKAVTADDLVSFQLQFKSGALATAVVSSVAVGWKGFSVSIYGEMGALFIEGESQLTMFRRTTAVHDLSFKDPWLCKLWVAGSIWRASFGRLVENFVGAVSGLEHFKGATFADGREVQRIIEAIRVSNREGRRVGVGEVENESANSVIADVRM